MALDWTNIATLVGGWFLAQLGSRFESKRSTANALVLARESRRYELGKEAYKAAMKAIGLGFEIADEDRTPSPDEVRQLLLDYYGAIKDARVVFGLPFSGKESEEIIDAFFIVPVAREKASDVNSAKTKAKDILRKHQNEFEEAWRRTIHGE